MADTWPQPDLAGSLQAGLEAAEKARELAEITGAVQAAMDTADQHRQAASQSPGAGSEMHLPQPPSGPGVGVSDVDLPIAGMGY